MCRKLLPKLMKKPQSKISEAVFMGVRALNFHPSTKFVEKLLGLFVFFGGSRDRLISFDKFFTQ
ncbi:hypothetical protein CRP01_19855 [Flavilitoribacter nigricans DSM 23189 = NBRC 102662]|uniref:Uncharacterized protein n=1 Tax=Flavilitoribacter nigricans (strain ATCC 23147 / DSM 23189 / NBRC 102662 / NCIMB 1420 / SS-2) TaxID=1122177 RepID=A0A2D0N9F0_FLAN2|nr:hypothetical protein CRP01_19855 [Flavilitoribacter nigricans DSM 23189 = NBRC 102662]